MTKDGLRTCNNCVRLVSLSVVLAWATAHLLMRITLAPLILCRKVVGMLIVPLRAIYCKVPYLATSIDAYIPALHSPEWGCRKLGQMVLFCTEAFTHLSVRPHGGLPVLGWLRSVLFPWIAVWDEWVDPDCNLLMWGMSMRIATQRAFA